jgi:hypothetical protein
MPSGNASLKTNVRRLFHALKIDGHTFFYWSEKVIATWVEGQTLLYIKEKVKFTQVFEQFQPEVKSQHFACQ